MGMTTGTDVAARVSLLWVLRAVRLLCVPFLSAPMVLPRHTFYPASLPIPIRLLSASKDDDSHMHTPYQG